MGYVVRKLKLGTSEQLDRLARACGEVYTHTLVFHRRVFRKKGIFLSKGVMQKLIPNSTDRALHAHTADACVDSYYDAWRSYDTLKKAGFRNVRAPRKRKWYFKIRYKSSAIRVREGRLILSNGNAGDGKSPNDPLVIPWQWARPKTVEIGWDGEQYELRATYVVEVQAEPIGKKVAGVDLGEIHIAAIYDGEQSYLYNGRLLRSLRQYRNKLTARLDSVIDQKQNGSKRRWKWIKSKKKQLAKLEGQIRDLEHKMTTHLVNTLFEAGVKTVVIGDVRDVRAGLDYGKKTNQKLHQWSHGRVRRYLTYKAQRLGMGVVLQDEAYTSQACPSCEHRKKPRGRSYRCAQCGFEGHRDVVGSINIRAKYLGMDGPSCVVGVMASPIGMRYKSHMPCGDSRRCVGVAQVSDLLKGRTA